MKILAALLLIVSMLAHSKEGEWITGAGAAMYLVHPGFSVSVYYSPDYECMVPGFILAGDPDIKVVELIIDGMKYEPVVIRTTGYLKDLPYVLFVMSDILVHDIKHGDQMRINTDVGYAMVNLAGSNAAIDRAQETCKMQQQPIAPAKPAEKSEELPVMNGPFKGV